ncbi:hypothetical protein DPMN_180145 [Dreissena polymorpha]|uniref:Uncharacterized protein n=1 Tax=Dreissena polymorpha TaxID=45954 RepID=A0A9D4EFQ7_DREPO|nr:hypothetical protein DPMN_180145 [Dreissena polymorpha]
MCAFCNGATDGKSWETALLMTNTLPSNIELLHASTTELQSFVSVYFKYSHDDVYFVSKKTCYYSGMGSCSPVYFSMSDEIYLSWLNDKMLDSHTIDLLCNNLLQSTYMSKFVAKQAIYYKNVFSYICSNTFNISEYKECTHNIVLGKDPFYFAMLIDWGRFAAKRRTSYNQACEILPNGTTVSISVG